MNATFPQITYQDALLADKSVCRTYSDGRIEWRRRLSDKRVEWQDNRGNSGIDELLGKDIIKRTFANGQVVYGREQGYGRTAWGDGILTVNRSSFGGRIGIILAGIGAGMLLGSIILPPQTLSAEEEGELRHRAARSEGSSDGSGGGNGGGYLEVEMESEGDDDLERNSSAFDSTDSSWDSSDDFG